MYNQITHLLYLLYQLIVILSFIYITFNLVRSVGRVKTYCNKNKYLYPKQHWNKRGYFNLLPSLFRGNLLKLLKYKRSYYINDYLTTYIDFGPHIEWLNTIIEGNSSYTHFYWKFYYDARYPIIHKIELYKCWSVQGVKHCIWTLDLQEQASRYYDIHWYNIDGLIDFWVTYYHMRRNIEKWLYFNWVMVNLINLLSELQVDDICIPLKVPVWHDFYEYCNITDGPIQFEFVQENIRYEAWFSKHEYYYSTTNTTTNKKKKKKHSKSNKKK